MRIAGGISLIMLPLVLMLAFALHFDSLSDFFVFKLRYEPATANEFMATLTNPNESRQYTIAHGIGYLGLPLIISTALCLGHILFKKRPWFALVGASLACIGTVYMGGVFGTWLSFAAIGNVTAAQVEGAIPALEALTKMQGALLLSSILSALSLLGLMVLAVGLFISRIVPRWSAIMIFIGNLMIIVFMDLDNLMFIGAFIMLLGMAPIGLKLLKKDEYEEDTNVGIGQTTLQNDVPGS
jgi:hypothetical protein